MKTGNDIFSLNGKNVLVTGATGHLGSKIAVALAEAGARVLINSRSLTKGMGLVTELRKQGFLADPAIFDITSDNEVENFISSLNGEALDILINNAYAGCGGTIEVSDSNDYIASYTMSVIAAHRLLKGLLPNLRQAVKLHGGAAVINVASMYAFVSPDLRIYDTEYSSNPPFYGAAKAALLQWTRYAACEYGREGIRVNAISPGPFPNLDIQKSSPQFIQKLVQKVPLNRIGTAEEICGPILFLASSASSFMTGVNLVVDGGWSSW